MTLQILGPLVCEPVSSIIGSSAEMLNRNAYIILPTANASLH